MLFGVNAEVASGVVPLVNLEPFQFKVPEIEKEKALIHLLIAISLVGICCLIIGVAVGRAGKVKRAPKRTKPVSGGKKGEENNYFLEEASLQGKSSRGGDEPQTRVVLPGK